jgi:TolB-like protein/class 3 adenylate cyclase
MTLRPEAFEMTEKRTQRKLAAILAVDVVGYSAQVRENEEHALAGLKALRAEVIDPKLAEYGGRLFKAMGDGALVEFPSAVDAVRFAIEVQSAIRKRHGSLSEHPGMQVRIGINVGDVVVEGGDIFGDGVNLAVRLEGLAEPGGLCISGSAHEQVRFQKDLRFESMGRQRVKNIEEPVTVFRLADGGAGNTSAGKSATPFRWRRPASAGILAIFLVAGGLAWWHGTTHQLTPASIEKMAFPLPDKPSIAVLPFTNISGDPEQEYFADGLTEDIITKLAGFPNFFVIARNSTNRFKGEAVDIRNVAEDLGVRYVLEGSVRRSQNKLRITAQLIDALNASHLWAQKYDRELNDVFVLQDEITREVASRLASNIVNVEFQRQSRQGTTNFEAYDLFLRGYKAIEIVTAKSNAEATRLFEQALERDPGYARAMVALGITRASNVRFRWASGPQDTMETALVLARRSVALAPNDEFIYRTLGGILRLDTQYEAAVDAYQSALSRSPSNPDVLMALAFTRALMGNGGEAVEYADTAMRLNPYPPAWYHSWRGIALFTRGDIENALREFDNFQKFNPDLHVTYMWKAASYSLIDKPEDAQFAVEQLMDRAHWFTIHGYLEQIKPRGINRERLVEGLRKAGVPE